MIITKLSLQRRDDQRVNVFVDEKYAFSLTVQQVADLGLKKGDQIDEADVTRFKRASSYGKLYARGLARALSRPHSQREMGEYLRRTARRRYPDVDEAALESIVTKLMTLGYINDERFTEYWVEMRQRHRRSNKSIRFELRGKGVPDDIIQHALSRDDKENIRLLVAKKRSKYSSTDKLMRYLASKGFHFDDITAVLAEADDSIT